MEHHLQQQVAELFFEMLAVAGLDRLDRLVRLLEEVAHQRLVGLLAVPGAFAPKPVHHLDEIEQARTWLIVGAEQDLDLGAGAVDHLGGEVMGQLIVLVAGEPHDPAAVGGQARQPGGVGIGALDHFDLVADGDRGRASSVAGRDEVGLEQGPPGSAGQQARRHTRAGEDDGQRSRDIVRADAASGSSATADLARRKLGHVLGARLRVGREWLSSVRHRRRQRARLERDVRAVPAAVLGVDLGRPASPGRPRRRLRRPRTRPW